MATLGDLTSTTASATTDQYLVRQGGVDYVQTRESLAASIANAEWSALVDYQVGAEVTGSDRVRYKAVQDNGVSSTIQDPTTDTGDVYWEPTQGLVLDDVLSLGYISEVLSSYVNGIGNSGYVQLSNGLMLQWGKSTTFTNSGSSFATATFPVPFPSGCVVCIPTPGTVSLRNCTLQCTEASKTTATFYAYELNTNLSGTRYANYLAIGH